MFSPFSNLWFAVTYNAVLRTSSTNTVDFAPEVCPTISSLFKNSKAFCFVTQCPAFTGEPSG